MVNASLLAFCPLQALRLIVAVGPLRLLLAVRLATRSPLSTRPPLDATPRLSRRLVLLELLRGGGGRPFPGGGRSCRGGAWRRRGSPEQRQMGTREP